MDLPHENEPVACYGALAEDVEAASLLVTPAAPGAPIPERAAAEAGQRAAEAAKALPLLCDYADPSTLAKLYLTMARAARAVGDTNAEGAALRRLVTISPEEQPRPEMRGAVTGETIAAAHDAALDGEPGVIRASGYMRVDGVPLRPGSAWMVAPGQHLVQWLVVSADGIGRIKGEVVDVRGGEQVVLSGTAGLTPPALVPPVGRDVCEEDAAPPRRPNPSLTVPFAVGGAALAGLGAASMYAGAVWLDQPSTAPDLGGSATGRTTALEVGGATAVGLGVALVLTPLVIHGKF